MECMATTALKSCLLTETSTKPIIQQSFNDDIFRVADDFSVDEFFDIPNEYSVENSSLFNEEDDDEEEKYSSSLSCDIVDNSHNFSSQLSIQVDDLQELELWSHLMDDSLPQEHTFTCPKPPPPIKPNQAGSNRAQTGRKKNLSRIIPSIPTPIPSKPRTSRSTIPSNWFRFAGSLFSFGEPVKKLKRKPVVETGDSPVQRRCSHCQVTKTPQWRTGPTGPKSLCNACGVRFKSGRLFPEYRPACSPTFSSDIHSNIHRKVLEMRWKKEAIGSLSL